MKPAEKGFRNNFRKFRALAKKVPCDTKLPLYWDLVQECMEKNEENAAFVRERCRIVTNMKLRELDRNLA